jgi:hypothetical protein
MLAISLVRLTMSARGQVNTPAFHSGSFDPALPIFIPACRPLHPGLAGHLLFPDKLVFKKV